MGQTPTKMAPVDYDPFAASSVVSAAVPGARVTSDLRDRAEQDALIAQGRTKAYNSRHLKPGGAEDFVPPAGETRAQAVARIRAFDPAPAELLNEGDHVHYAPGPNARKITPVDHDPFAAPTAADPGFQPWYGGAGKGLNLTAPTPTARTGSAPARTRPAAPPPAKPKGFFGRAGELVQEGAGSIDTGIRSLPDALLAPDPVAAGKAAMEILGGGYHMAAAVPRSYLEHTAGIAANQATKNLGTVEAPWGPIGGPIDPEMIGDVGEQVGGFVLGGPKPRGPMKIGAGSIAEYTPEAGGTGAAMRRGAKRAKPVAPAQPTLTPVEGDPFAAKQWQRAYHGTPHEFDQFGTEHIGKGEGSQSFGHGLYFAENPNVAQHYRNLLSPRKVSDPAADVAGYWLEQAGGDAKRAADMARKYSSDSGFPDAANEAVSHIENPPGFLYQTDIPHAQHFLDFDKTFAQQPAGVQAALERLGLKPLSASETGLSLHDRLSSQLGSDKAAAEALDAEGVAGTKYLDQFSRRHGKGTSNFVVFNAANVRNANRRTGGLGAEDLASPTLTPVEGDPFKGKAIAAADEPPDALSSDVLVAPGKPRTPAAPVPPAAAPSLLQQASSLASAPGTAVRKVFAPATVDDDARAAANTIRASNATHQLMSDQTAHDMLRFDAQSADMAPGTARYTDLTNYLEGESRGVKLGDKSLEPVANAIRKSNQGYRDQIAAVLDPEHLPSFYQDYFAHMWNEAPTVVADTMGSFSRQGSGRNLRQRSIPTIADGIAAGLTPKFGPVQTQIAYGENMSRYLTTQDILRQGSDAGYVKWAKPGQQPEGWVPLNGMNTTRARGYNIADGTERPPVNAFVEQRFAPDGYARVYNNFISKGFEAGDWGPFMGGARQAANAQTMLKLGLSGFHGVTMTSEAIASEAARGLKAALSGDFMQAGKSAANFGSVVGPAITSTLRGNRMRSELLSGAAKDPVSQEINDLYIAQGGRVNMDKLYRVGQGRTAYQAAKQDIGSVASAAKQGGGNAAYTAIKGLKTGAMATDVRAAASRLYRGTPWEKTKTIASMAGNVIQSAAGPIFEDYIPRLKQGAFAQRMGDFLKQNPAADDAEKLDFARKLGDSIDNRFGELVQDNLFWDKRMKQAAQIALVSPTWNIGTVREIGGGLADVVPSARQLLAGKGLNVSERTAYVAGLAATVALTSSIYQYLKTGTLPGDAQDLMAPRSGGTQRVGGKYGRDVPERAALPGYQKDVYGFTYDFPNHILDEGTAKLNTFPRTAAELLTNRDFRDMPIRPEKGAQVRPGDPGLGDYLLDAATPISGKAGERYKGSNISGAERILGIRPSPGYVAAPDVTLSQAQRRAKKAWKYKQDTEKRDRSRMESSF